MMTMNDDPQRGHRQHHRDFPIRISIIATSKRRNVYGSNELSVMKSSSHNHTRTMNGRTKERTDTHTSTQSKWKIQSFYHGAKSRHRLWHKTTTIKAI